MAGFRDPIGDPIGILATAACAAALTLVAPIATCIAIAFVLLAVASPRIGRPRTAVLGALVFVIGAWRASSTVERVEDLRAAVIRAGPHRPARALLAGTVASSPMMIGDAQRLDVDVHAPFVARVALHVPRDEAP